MASTVIPEVAQRWVERMRGNGENRPEFTAKVVTREVPEGAVIVQVGWKHTGFGRGNASVIEKRVTQWAAWYGGEWVGSAARQRDVRDILATHIRVANEED